MNRTEDGHNPRQTEEKPLRPKQARVVKLKTWKAKKQVRLFMGQYSVVRYVIRQVSYVLCFVAAIAAVVSCFPSDWQLKAVLWAWAIGIVGACLALVLHVLHDYRRSKQLFTAFGACLGLSLMVALLQVL